MPEEIYFDGVVLFRGLLAVLLYIDLIVRNILKILIYIRSVHRPSTVVVRDVGLFYCEIFDMPLKNLARTILDYKWYRFRTFLHKIKTIEVHKKVTVAYI